MFIYHMLSAFIKKLFFFRSKLLSDFSKFVSETKIITDTIETHLTLSCRSTYQISKLLKHSTQGRRFCDFCMKIRCLIKNWNFLKIMMISILIFSFNRQIATLLHPSFSHIDYNGSDFFSHIHYHFYLFSVLGNFPQATILLMPTDM